MFISTTLNVKLRMRESGHNGLDRILVLYYFIAWWKQQDSARIIYTKKFPPIFLILIKKNGVGVR